MSAVRELITKARYNYPKTESGYADLWRRAVRDLWRSFEAHEPIREGERRRIRYGGTPYTISSWRRDMRLNIQTYLTAAWEKAAAGFGIKPDEFTDSEKDQLRDMLNQQANLDYLDRFYRDALDLFRRDPRGKPEDMFSRAQLWANRWKEVTNAGKAVFGRNRKLRWVLGETHEHCRTCFGLNGRVYRASTWNENGALPQTHALECEGYNCLCRLEETTDRTTPGPFPRGLLVS